MFQFYRYIFTRAYLLFGISEACGKLWRCRNLHQCCYNCQFCSRCRRNHVITSSVVMVVVIFTVAAADRKSGKTRACQEPAHANCDFLCFGSWLVELTTCFPWLDNLRACCISVELLMIAFIDPLPWQELKNWDSVRMNNYCKNNGVLLSQDYNCSEGYHFEIFCFTSRANICFKLLVKK